MVRRLIVCTLASAGLFCAFSRQVPAQVQPVALDSQQSEDLYDRVLVRPKAASIPQKGVAVPQQSAVNQRAPGLIKVMAGEQAAPLPVVVSEPAAPWAPAAPAAFPFLSTNCTPDGCLPPAPFPSGIAPPPGMTDPALAPPTDPGTTPPAQDPSVITPPPATQDPASPSTSPAPSQFDPGNLSQPSSNIPNSNQSQFDFSAGFNSQTLLASRDVPAMVGDFFGSGAAQTICIQPESFLFQGPDQVVQFNTGFHVRNYSNAAGFGQTLPDDFIIGPDFVRAFFVDQASSATGGPDFAIPPTEFNSVTLNPTVTTIGTPLPSATTLTSPGSPPVPGSFVQLQQVDNQAVIETQALADQHGFQQQKDAFEVTNGTGTFVDGGPGSVALGPAFATLITPGTFSYEDEYAIQQLEAYTPDATTFTPDPVLVTPAQIKVDIPGGAVASMPGMQVGRMKLTENTSPIPRDRAYVNYSYFDNTPLFPGGVNVNRVTPGIEKTFMDGNMSIEVRVPFATTLDSDIINGGITNTNDTQIGNVTSYLKALLYDNEAWALSAGVGVAVPTASDANVIDAATGNTLIGVENNSIHLLPFVGGAYIPNSRLFVQSILQFDIDLNGNPISATSFDQGIPTGNLSRIGNGRDQTLMYYDISMGYWIPTFIGPVTRVAPILEYHLNQTVQDGQNVSGQAGNTLYNFSGATGTSLSNGVVGLVASLNDKATLTVAYAAPLGGSDQQFDGEVRVLFNWFFGGNTPLRYGPGLQ